MIELSKLYYICRLKVKLNMLLIFANAKSTTKE
jgi:hypothetical protein